jgi:fructoselysine 6-kinase
LKQGRKRLLKIIAVGDNVVDVYIDQEIMYPGGNALNVAVLCKRYGAEKSSYIGLIGNDSEGEYIEQVLRKESLDISRMRKAIGETGKSKVALNKNADRVFSGWNKGGVQSELKLQFTNDDIKFIKLHKILHTSVYSYLEDELPLLSENILLSFDFSTYRKESYLKFICPYLEFAFFSGSDLNSNSCLELIELAHRLGANNVVVTRGADGAIFSGPKALYEQSSVEVEVVDTLGAGDSFISMFLTQYYKSSDIKHIMQKAAEAAAETCKYYGALGYGIPFKEKDF